MTTGITGLVFLITNKHNNIIITILCAYVATCQNDLRRLRKFIFDFVFVMKVLFVVVKSEAEE